MVGNGKLTIYKGYQLYRDLMTNSFSYGGEWLPSRIVNFDMAEKFIDKYLLPKMIEIGLYSEKGWNSFVVDWRYMFPKEHRQTMADEIKKHIH